MKWINFHSVLSENVNRGVCWPIEELRSGLLQSKFRSVFSLKKQKRLFHNCFKSPRQNNFSTTSANVPLLISWNNILKLDYHHNASILVQMASCRYIAKLKMNQYILVSCVCTAQKIRKVSENPLFTTSTKQTIKIFIFLLTNFISFFDLLHSCSFLTSESIIKTFNYYYSNWSRQYLIV